MGSRMRAVGVVLAALVAGAVFASPASAAGSWMYTSSDHSQLQISFQTDNGQSAFFEVFTLNTPVTSATCPGGGSGTVGQPDGKPNQFECQLSPPATSGIVSVTTQSLEACGAQFANKAS